MVETYSRPQENAQLQNTVFSDHHTLTATRLQEPRARYKVAATTCDRTRTGRLRPCLSSQVFVHTVSRFTFSRENVD